MRRVLLLMKCWHKNSAQGTELDRNVLTGLVREVDGGDIRKLADLIDAQIGEMNEAMNESTPSILQAKLAQLTRDPLAFLGIKAWIISSLQRGFGLQSGADAVQSCDES